VKKMPNFVTMMLIVGSALAAAPASSLSITLQQCLNMATARYNATIKDCNKLGLWERLSCYQTARSNYYLDRNMCYKSPLPVQPLPSPVGKP
jgi:hypothetical protein